MMLLQMELAVKLTTNSGLRCQTDDLQLTNLWVEV
jgi:hypothetical protein